MACHQANHILHVDLARRYQTIRKKRMDPHHNDCILMYQLLPAVMTAYIYVIICSANCDNNIFIMWPKIGQRTLILLIQASTKTHQTF